MELTANTTEQEFKSNEDNKDEPDLKKDEVALSGMGESNTSQNGEVQSGTEGGK